MAAKPRIKNKKIYVIIFFVLLVAGAFIITQTSHAPSTKEETLPSTTVPTQKIEGPKEITLSGETVCLPHKNTSGPQTLECAIGLKASDGNYYALDTNQISGSAQMIDTGKQIQAVGMVTPVEALSSDHWQKYNIKGIFSVKSVEEISN